MSRFEVELYPVMFVRIAQIEAEDSRAAIQRAVAIAEAQYLSAAGDGRQALVFTHEYVRYVVTPMVDATSDSARSETFLDAASVSADQRDLSDGFPCHGLDALPDDG